MPSYKVLHEEGQQLRLLEIGDSGDVGEGGIRPKEVGDMERYPGIGDRPQNGELMAGWMWYDDHPGRSIEDKIRRAVERYHAKFGEWPNTCRVNRQAIRADFRCGRVSVVGVRNVLLHHFFLGVVDGVVK